MVLFLCTGNYYRSRFAELLFDHLAAERGLHWRARSRGLAVDSATNVGPISSHAMAALAERGIAVNAPRMPAQLTAADLQAADRVVAVKAAEHRPRMQRQFAQWADAVTYWHIDDLDCATPETALSALEHNVGQLIDQLAGASGTTPA